MTTDCKSGSAKSLHEYPTIHSIPTHVIKYGKVDEKKRLVFVVPGNPGAVEFYDEFMRRLHEASGWPVWGMSHAGHSMVPSRIRWNKPNTDVFTVEGQIQHKVYFVNEFIPDDVEVVLIGHSIGARLILEIMDRIPRDRVIQGMLLFPTLEKMATSPRGRRLTPILKYWRWLLILIAAMIWLLPFKWKTGLIDYVFDKRKKYLRGEIPVCITEGALSVVDPYCVKNAIYMAHLEMQEIVDLPEEALKRHISKLQFYYGATDHWCPTDHYHRMKALFPKHKKIELCTSGYRHAFIIDSSQPMAQKVSDWLTLL